MKIKYDTHWTTQDELKHLRSIKQGVSFGIRKRNPSIVLKGYARGAKQKKVWGHIEKEKIFKWLRENGYF